MISMHELDVALVFQLARFGDKGPWLEEGACHPYAIGWSMAWGRRNGGDGSRVMLKNDV